MRNSLPEILLGVALLFTIVPIAISKSKYKNHIEEIWLRLSVLCGIIIFLFSFAINPPFHRSKQLVNNQYITKNYTDRLVNDSKNKLIVCELLKSKFLAKDTLFFKGTFLFKEEVRFAVFTLISKFVSDSTITFNYNVNYSSKNAKVFFESGDGYIELNNLKIYFSRDNSGSVKINDFGKLELFSASEEKWNYVEF